MTRGGYDWTDRFPAIAAEARLLGLKTAILDGEAVVLDEHGRSDFGMLQRVLGSHASAASRGSSPTAVTSPITPAVGPTGRRSRACAATAS
ncbi:ATP-dependent DNA ligase clustered with Ku protein, LigD (plasmid) [Sinorhizobium sp. CCBAU 05631]|nr:ATP-dependent DNA ligase clustered with Ku protein, LigD [Sinorhizobium sp. CCBAU 05631]